jgi:hypothetical protein
LCPTWRVMRDEEQRWRSLKKARPMTVRDNVLFIDGAIRARSWPFG